MRSERARRPAYLLTGLLRCGACGGGCSMISAQHYGCSNARNRATCDNRLVIRRDVLETSVLEGLKNHLMHPDLVKTFIAEYHTELNRLMAERERAGDLWSTQLNQVARQIRAIIDAIKEGIRTPSMQEELLALEVRKVELEARFAEKPQPMPRLHPNLAEIYRKKVARLREELNREETRVQAAGALRDLIEAVRLVPENGKLEIELVGELAAILSLCEEQRGGTKNPRRRAAGVQETMVAGTGFEPVTFRL
jgi:site-specific DNA recombinase